MRVEEESSDDSDSCASEDGIDLKDIEDIMASPSPSKARAKLDPIIDKLKSNEYMNEPSKSPNSESLNMIPNDNI